MTAGGFRDGEGGRRRPESTSSDGETSKISYATYVKDRYTGFDGDSPRNAPADLKMFPSFLDRLADRGARRNTRGPCASARSAPRGQGELQKDIANLKAAMAEHGAERGFMNAASPGVISLFLQNDHYPTREAYLAALADAMKDEYEPSSPPGWTCSSIARPRAVAAHAVHRSERCGVRQGRQFAMSRR